MEFKEFYVSNEEGKSNCVIRTFCKMFDKKYNDVYEELYLTAKQLGAKSFNDIEVFETYMMKYDTQPSEYGKDIKIKDLKLETGRYAVFCWDKKDFYHMVTIIDNVLYDKDDRSLELYVITIYKCI